MCNIECNFTNMLKQVFGGLLFEVGIFGRGGGGLQWYYQDWIKLFFPWQIAWKQFITGMNFVFQNEYMYIL